MLKCRGCRENGFQWLEFTKGPATDKAQLASCTDRCTAILNIGEESREKEKGADRRAVWRIGAQSEGVEKSLHLNAPLHPNNSSAAKKKKNKAKRKHLMLCLSLLSSASLFIRAAVKGTHLAAIHLAVHVHACVLM